MSGGFILPGSSAEGEIIDATKLSQRRRVAEAMALQGSDYSPIASPWQGLARVAQGALGGYESGQLDRQEADERKRISGLSFFDDDASPARANVAAALSGDAAPPATASTKPAPTFTSTDGQIGDYLSQTRARESGGNDLAANPSSSAKGRYQFTDQTWAGVAKRHPDLGLQPGGWRDPGQQEKAMAAFTGDNAKALTSAGLPINPANLYGLHFLGEAGGPKFIAGAINSPDAPASSFVSSGAVSANRSVFFNKDGTPKTAGQVYAWMGGGGGKPQTPQTRVADALADVPAEGAQEAQFQIPGQDQRQTPGRATVTDAMTGGGGRKINLRNVMEVAGSQFATPQQRAVAQALAVQATKPAEFGFQKLDEGTIVRTDPRSGTVAPAYQGQGKTELDVREVNGRLVATDKRGGTAKDITPEGLGGSKLSREAADRKQLLIDQGLNPNDARNRDYLLTGNLPKENQQLLTAGDKKAVLDADDTVIATKTAIDALRQAKALSPKANSGPLASQRGYVGSLFGTQDGLATTDLDNLVTTNALTQLKATFGAAPTEGERKILLDIQGSSSLPDAARQRIYDRGIALAEARMNSHQQRADELRGGTFYRPGSGASGAAPPASGASPGAPPRSALEAEARRRGLIQ